MAAPLDTMHSLEESLPEVVSPGDLSLLKALGKASVAAKRAGAGTWGKGMGPTLMCGWCDAGERLLSVGGVPHGVVIPHSACGLPKSLQLAASC